MLVKQNSKNKPKKNYLMTVAYVTCKHYEENKEGKEIKLNITDVVIPDNTNEEIEKVQHKLHLELANLGLRIEKEPKPIYNIRPYSKLKEYLRRK